MIGAEAHARFGSESEPVAFHHRTRFLFGLLREAGLNDDRARLKNVKVKGGSALCIALASSLLPQSVIEKLMALLNTDEEPKWYG
jgi:hypothetical protein